MSTIDPYKKFAENMFHPDSKYIPKILKSMLTDEQAHLLISMPGTLEQLSQKTGRSSDAIDTDLQDLFFKGLAFKKLKQGDLIWRGPLHLVQFHDATIVWPDAGDEFFRLWRVYMEEEWPTLAPILSQVSPRPFTRVIPVGKSVETGRTQVLAPESVKQIIADATRIAVTRCTCRLIMAKCDGPLEVCLQINRGADYTIERGTGKEISKSQALEVIQTSEEAGLVHVTINKADAGHFICNCCGCCCQSFSMLINNVNLCDPSRYTPKIDTDNCTACGTCEERCQFNAIVVDRFAKVDLDKCLGCGQCAFICPTEVITMIAKREPDFIPQ